MSFMFSTIKKKRLSAGQEAWPTTPQKGVADHAHRVEVCVCCVGTWVGKILADMKGKANPGGNKDMKLFLYSAVSGVRKEY